MTAALPEAEFQAGQLALSPDGRTLYSAGAALHAWDAHTLKLRWTAPPATAARPAGSDPPGRMPPPLALSPDGRQLVTAGSGPGEVELRDTSSGQLRQSLPHPGPSAITPDNAWSLDVTALAYDPTGRQLAIGSRAGGIRLHDLRTGQERRLTGRCGGVSLPYLTAHQGSVGGLVWTGTATLISSANDETVKRWDTLAGLEVTCLSVPGGTRGLQVLPDDRLLALGVTSATLLDAGQFRRVARLGPFPAMLRELSVLECV
ncbi:hypothetical protein GCM10008939_23710 [Deinococcus aquiradiocola]|uniref:Uncharacterized protein n=1 Tax=Deinococcus aquiradiocola TaxID=393059 RepID=A0A917PHJ2_9DEIO|nr:hypothetical protein GCM10008939_23710 [Deinococcus aquiradiocola]